MRNKISNSLVVAIIFITIMAIRLNLNIDFTVTLKTVIVTLIYLISWLIFINIALKHKVNHMKGFYYSVWGATLATSIILVIVNAIPYIADYFSFVIILVLIFITPISGIGFPESNLLSAVVFSIVSAIFMLIPTIKTRYIKLKENK